MVLFSFSNGFEKLEDSSFVTSAAGSPLLDHITNTSIYPLNESTIKKPTYHDFFVFFIKIYNHQELGPRLAKEVRINFIKKFVAYESRTYTER